MTVTLDNNWGNKYTLFSVVNFSKFVVTEVFSSVVASQGSVATHLRCGVIFSDSVFAVAPGRI